MERRCTNFTDSTGKLVFEGDLLMWIKGGMEFTAIIERCTEEEDSEESEFWIKSSSGGGGFVNERYLKNFEVINL